MYGLFYKINNEITTSKNYDNYAKKHHYYVIKMNWFETNFELLQQQ